MINLIPPTAKRDVKAEYWVRVISVWLFTLSCAVLSFVTLLIPINVLISKQIKVYEPSATAALTEVSKFDVSSTALVQTGVQSRLILDLRNKTSFSSLISLIESLQNPDIVIESYGLIREKDKISPISVTGKAVSRQALAGFRESLLGNEEVVTVLLPISNLAQDRNIPFTLTITMKETK